MYSCFIAGLRPRAAAVCRRKPPGDWLPFPPKARERQHCRVSETGACTRVTAARNSASSGAAIISNAPTWPHKSIHWLEMVAAPPAATGILPGTVQGIYWDPLSKILISFSPMQVYTVNNGEISNGSQGGFRSIPSFFQGRQRSASHVCAHARFTPKGGSL